MVRRESKCRDMLHYLEAESWVVSANVNSMAEGRVLQRVRTNGVQDCSEVIGWLESAGARADSDWINGEESRDLVGG
jgi:hypothetical protein